MSNQTTRNMIITKKKKIGPAMWVMECPKCGRICAGATEKSWLPEITSCNCDEQEKKRT